MLTADIRIIDEHTVPGMRLGRHVHHDPRSLAYQVKPRAAFAVSKAWDRRTSILDQGNLGSCTGNAMCGVLGTEPFYDTLTPALAKGLVLDENEAKMLYSQATQLDGYAGTWPPTDTGSDGLSVAKAAQKAGLISGYQHCTSLDAVITALQNGPLVTGVNWYDSFDQPDANGVVTISPGATVRGGHEFELRRVDVENKRIGADNSWGASWGVGGTFWIGYDDYARLLSEQGDATVPVPITQPAPQPTPTPSGDADAALAGAAHPWVAARHVGSNAVMQRALKAWLAAKGL